MKAEDYSDEKIPDKDSKDRLFVEKVESLYPFYEEDDALGSWGIQNASINGVDIPSNYNEINVKNKILEIKDGDGDGRCDILPSYCIISVDNRGDNHLGYMGFRDDNSKSIIDTGAMNIVASTWLVS